MLSFYPMNPSTRSATGRSTTKTLLSLLTVVLLAVGCGNAATSNGLQSNLGGGETDTGGTLQGDVVIGGADAANFDDTMPAPDTQVEPDVPPTPVATTIVASVQTPSAQVGTPTAIGCQVLDQNGAAMEPQPAGVALLVQTPLQLVAKEAGFGLAVTTTKAGSYEVRCALEASSLASSPVTVTFNPGAMAKVVAQLDPAQVVAGDAGSKIKCLAADSFGNLLQGGAQAVPSTIKADEDVYVAIDIVSSKKTGPHTITCVPIGPMIELGTGSATLTVIPAAPMRARAIATPETVSVDQTVTIACTAYDDFENLIEPQPSDWSLTLPDGCSSKGLTLSCTKAGVHDVACASADVPKSIPTKVTVAAGKAIKLELVLDPDKPNYGTGQVIQLIGKAWDSYGNPLIDPELTPIQIKPVESVDVDKVNARVTFGQDGLYEIKVGVAGAPGVSASRNVRVDTSGPLINVSSPPRGHSMLWAATTPVTYSVVDELSKLVGVTFNDKDVQFGDGISITSTLPLGHGVHAVKIQGKDEWDNASSHVQAILAAKKFVAAETKAGAAANIAHGLEFWLGQEAIDSGVHSHTKPRDLASVFEIVLKNLDLSIIVGKSFPVSVTGLSGDATVNSFAFGNKAINGGYPKIALTAKSGGLGLVGTIWKVVSTVNLKGKGIGFIPVNIDATVTADSMKLTADVALSATSGGVVVKTKNVKVELVSLDVNIDNGWGFLVNWLLDLFNGSITTLFENTLSSQLGAAIDGPLGSALTDIGIQTTFNIPGLFGGKPVTVAMDTAPTALQVFSASTGKDAGAWLKLRTALTSAKTVPHKSLGVAMRQSCLGNSATLASFARQEPLEVAMHFDLANQLFAALWQAGGLSLQLDAAQLSGFDLKAYGLGAITIDVNMLMPPLLSDCTVGGKTELQLGDVQLDVKTKMDGKDVVIRAYLTAAAQVAASKVAGLNGPEIGLDVLGIVRLDTDVDMVLVGGVAAPEGTIGFFEKLLPMVANLLIGALQGTLASFPLPELDLSVMAQSIPPGTVLALDISKVGATPGHVEAVGGIKK